MTYLARTNASARTVDLGADMERMKVVMLGAALALPVAAVGVLRAADAAPPTKGSAAAPAGCIEMGSAGHQIWHGPAPKGDASAMADALESIAAANRDQVSGVAVCSDFSGDAIFVAGPSRDLLARIAAVGAKYPKAALHVVSVANGLAAQLAAARRLMLSDPSGSSLTGMGPNISTGGLRVDVRADQWPVSDALRQRVTAAATSNGAVTMPVNFRLGGEGTNLSAR